MRTRCVLLMMVLLLAKTAGGRYLFTTLSSADGLSSKNIACAYRDSSGFMWFGAANGLNRYDGSQFKVITPYSTDIPGLPNESITSILEHGRGRLWIGTRSGLCYLDRRRSRFVEVPLLRGKDTIRNAVIRKLLIDGRGRLWAATGSGLFCERRQLMLPVSSIYPKAGMLDSFACTAYDAGKAAPGLILRGSKDMRFLGFETGELWSGNHNPGRWPLLDSGVCNVLTAGPDGRIWYSRMGSGLEWFNPSTGSRHVFPNWKDRLVYQMSFDSRGRLWLNVTVGKVFVMHADDRFQELTYRPEDPYGLAFPGFNHLYEDRDRNLWFSTANGVSKLPSRPVLESLVPIPGDSRHIVSLIPNDSAHVWISRTEDLLLADTRRFTFRNYTLPASWIADGNRVYDIQRIGEEWWCGSGTGIFKLDLGTAEFSRLKSQPGTGANPSPAIMWIRRDGAGTIWAALFNAGIYRYDAVADAWHATTGAQFGDPEAMNSYFGFVDRRGELYAGFDSRGVRRYDRGLRKWINPVADSLDGRLSDRTHCYGMVEDAEGSKWISTDRKGIFKLDAQGRISDSISLKDGLHSNAVGSLRMQDNGRLWISTTEGLQHTLTRRKMLSGFVLDKASSVVNFSFPMQIVGQKLIVGIKSQLAVIDLGALESQQAASPRPLLTGLQVSGKNRPLPYDSGPLKLDHSENFFSVSFSSPLHREMPAMAYAYKLEGLDKDWVIAGRNQVASYTSVPPGRYRFLVRTTNADGEWSENFSSVELHISPPFWTRWWAILLALAALAVLGLAVYRSSRRRRQAKQLEQAVNYFANSVYGHSVSEICWDIGRNCIAQMNLEDCVVYLRDEHRPVLIQRAAYGPKNTEGFAINNPIEIAIGQGIVGAVAATGKAILVPDTSKDPRYLVDDQARASELAVPIIHDGEVIGVIDSEHSKKGYYTEEHLRAFTTIASITSNKIAEAQAEAEVKEKAVQLLQIQKSLAESQLMALRAQMNPHFVFNCLNSIQECIVTAKYGEASLYLNKFSKLFRMLLNNSGRNMISLAEEIEVLELYLALEHMRFERSFDYSIDVDEELDLPEILIPSMLLQPFVENALWHGLMHKASDRCLRISFETLGDELFRCTIDDNGIGREAAKKLKSTRGGGSKHQSMGMRITAERIELMQRQGQAASIRIVDKTDAAGQAAGTTIIIELSAYLTATHS